MGERTIELTITNGLTDEENDRARRLIVTGRIFHHDQSDGDGELDRYLFAAHDEDGVEYVVAIRNEPAEEVWTTLWSYDLCEITIDRGFVMRAIPSLPPESDEKPIAPEVD